MCCLSLTANQTLRFHEKKSHLNTACQEYTIWHRPVYGLLLKAGIRHRENSPYKMFIWVKTQTNLFRYFTSLQRLPMKLVYVIKGFLLCLLALLLFPQLHEVQRAIEVTSVVPVPAPVTFAVESSRSPYLDNQKACILGP